MANSKKARPDGGASGRVPGCDTAGQQSHEKYNTRQKQKTSIFDMLPVGAECAISRRALAALTGLSDRQLRYKISQERKAARSFYRPPRAAEGTIAQQAPTSCDAMCSQCAVAARRLWP